MGGRVGPNSAVFSSPVFYPSPPEKWLWGECAGSFPEKRPCKRTYEKGRFIRVGQAIFHHKLEINWNHRFASDQIRMTAASTVSLVCITVSNFPYPLYRKEHQHVEPIYQNFSKLRSENKSTFILHFSDPLISVGDIQNSGLIKLSSHNHHTDR